MRFSQAFLGFARLPFLRFSSVFLRLVVTEMKELRVFQGFCCIQFTVGFGSLEERNPGSEERNPGCRALGFKELVSLEMFNDSIVYLYMCFWSRILEFLDVLLFAAFVAGLCFLCLLCFLIILYYFGPCQVIQEGPTKTLLLDIQII